MAGLITMMKRGDDHMTGRRTYLQPIIEIVLNAIHDIGTLQKDRPPHKKHDPCRRGNPVKYKFA